jgi:tripartite-type tricarboxylate transporter receptor subunit TctC
MRSYVQALLAAAFCCATGAYAQKDYPVKPVRVIVPSSPGGGTDAVGRVIGAHLSQAFGQQFVIDNRAGAAGMVGYLAAASSAPDGYTLLVAPTTITSLHVLSKVPQFDVVKDFAPITQAVASSQVLVIHPSVAARSLRDLVQLAKQKPDELAFASPGEGSVPHLAVELLKHKAGIEMRHIPYKGVAPALTDVMAGRVQAMLVNVISAKTHVDGGRVRALAVTSLKRTDALRDVPTIAESGYPGYEALQWFGFFTRAGTPSPIVMRLYGEIAKALRDPEVKKRFVDEEPIGNTPAEFTRVVRAEVSKWTEVARVAKLQPN